jgi:hypothetical protein
MTIYMCGGPHDGATIEVSHLPIEYYFPNRESIKVMAFKLPEQISENKLRIYVYHKSNIKYSDNKIYYFYIGERD